jgi:hypothetical protein
MRAPEPTFLILFVIMVICLGLGAYVVNVIESCNRPGFVPYGCPIVIKVGR